MKKLLILSFIFLLLIGLPLVEAKKTKHVGDRGFKDGGVRDGGRDKDTDKRSSPSGKRVHSGGSSRHFHVSCVIPSVPLGTPSLYDKFFKKNIYPFKTGDRCPVLNPRFVQICQSAFVHPLNRGRDCKSSLIYWSSWVLRK